MLTNAPHRAGLQSAHQIQEPSAVAEAQNINLHSSDDPSSSKTNGTNAPASTTASSAAADTNSATKANLAKPTLPHGMSATSGPLGDHLAGEEFGLGHEEEVEEGDTVVPEKDGVEVPVVGEEKGEAMDAGGQEMGEREEVEGEQRGSERTERVAQEGD